MTESMKKALEAIGIEWSEAPSGVKSSTLLALERRGLIESKCLDAWSVMYANLPYTSSFYHWRIKP